jgi:beta-glucosidase
MGAAFVRAFEEAGVVTTPKHFVANVGEGGRDSYPIAWSERALAERYFPPFVAALGAGARSIMTAYNSVDGLPATQNRRLLREILKGDWAFSGFVISDASATSGATVLHMTEASTATAATRAFAAGLDVVFQSQYGQQRPYLDAFRRGLIPLTTIDEAVSRVLRVKFQLGLFEQPYVDAGEAAAANGHADHRAVAREAAAKSLVLLRNHGGVLPLTKTMRSIAVIGVDAEEARLGGYSGSGNDVVSVLEGITRAVGSATAVRFERGPGRSTGTFTVVPAEQLSATVDGVPARGLRGEYFDNPRLEGAPRFRRTDARMDFRWTLNSPGRGIPFDWYSVRWTGTLTVPSGVEPARVGVEGNDGYRLYLDDGLVLDNWIKRSYGTRTVEVAPGTYRIRLEYFEATGNARVRLVWDDPRVADTSGAAVDRAVALARGSDVVVIVAGVEEGEFRDRARLGLPGLQPELINAVAGTGKPTVVVLVGGSAITMPWLERADAVLHAWYPGEAGGDAIADVIFGDVNPAGRLPVTFPVAEGQLPLSYNHKPTGRGDDYVDLTGQPLFPFGFGLSYTTFEYSDLVLDPAETTADGAVTVRCRIRNSGTRAGDEVVQLYVRDVLASVARPVMELRGFTRVHLRPGEEREISVRLGRDDFRMLDERMQWVVEPGVFRILVGSSSKDIRLRGHVVVR